uniref:Uncharacterized protein n=1 Tax=Plectus sambesii TaxID=2011161 RepID=A0A914XBP1_9BILA
MQPVPNASQNPNKFVCKQTSLPHQSHYYSASERVNVKEILAPMRQLKDGHSHVDDRGRKATPTTVSAHYLSLSLSLRLYSHIRAAARGRLRQRVIARESRAARLPFGPHLYSSFNRRLLPISQRRVVDSCQGPFV